MKPNGSTSPALSASTVTVDNKNLPSRGRSLQNDANEGRSRAGVVPGRSMTKATVKPHTGFGLGNVWAGGPGGWRGCMAVAVSLVVSATCAIAPYPLPGRRSTHEQEVGCANRQGQVVRRREGFRLSQR